VENINTFDDLFWYYLEFYNVSESTRKDLISRYKNHIKGIVGKYRLDKLTFALLQSELDIYIRETAPYYKGWTRIIQNIKEIFTWAYTRRIISKTTKDLIFDMHLPRKVEYIGSKREVEPVRFYDEFQLKTIMSLISDYSMATGARDGYQRMTFSIYIELMILLGTRPSEALAIHWTDVDFESNIITISKTVSNDGASIGPTKTRTTRKISLNQTMINKLKTFKEYQQSAFNEFEIDTDPIFIFTNLKNILQGSDKPWYKYKNMKDTWFRICHKSNFPYLNGLHCFRHTHATLQLKNHGDYHFIAQRLGHKNVSETIDTYAHLMETKRLELDLVFDQYINNLSNQL